MTQRKKQSEPNGEREREVVEIEADLDRTRDAISQDLRELGDRLSPEHIKQEVKNQVRHAASDVKDAASEKLREMKDGAAEKLREAKDTATETLSHVAESVTETMDQVRGGARRAGESTLSFVKENAIPLTLLGVGSAWLIANQRSRSDSGEWRPPSPTTHLRERAQTRAHELAERAERAASSSAQRARDLAQREALRARDIAESNPLALGAAALLAGVGLGLLLPPSRTENALLGPSRDRLLEGAKETVQDLEAAAKNMGATAKETAREMKNGLSGTLGAR